MKRKGLWYKRVVVISFCIYLPIVALVTIQDELIKDLVHYGFWLVLGMNLGVILGDYFRGIDTTTP